MEVVNYWLPKNMNITLPKKIEKDVTYIITKNKGINIIYGFSNIFKFIYYNIIFFITGEVKIKMYKKLKETYMRKIGNYYIDENNNRWDANLYTEEQAIKYSESLVNCSNCSNCSNCFHCSHCSHCSNCSNCFHCSDCSNCSICSDCSNCSDCSHCSNCSNCSHCSHCSNCSNCSDCSNCSNCSNCSDCSNCSNCSDYKDNPERVYSKKIGSRNSQTVIYQLDENIQVICGCFKGNLTEFEETIKETYPDKNNKYRKQYDKFLEKVKQYYDISNIREN